MPDAQGARGVPQRDARKAMAAEVSWQAPFRNSFVNQRVLCNCTPGPYPLVSGLQRTRCSSWLLGGLRYGSLVLKALPFGFCNTRSPPWMLERTGSPFWPE